MRSIFISLLMIVHSLSGYTQSLDTRPVVGVTPFTFDESNKYIGLVTEKVVEMLTNSKRFQVVDRTSYDKVQAELDLEKNESFMDSKNRVKEDGAVAAEELVTGHITKIPIYAIRNGMGEIQGYKASVAFQMKIVNTETGISTEATSFQGKSSDLMLSPESAVTAAMQSLGKDLTEYFRFNFPITAKILKIIENKKDCANLVLINAGTKQGLHIGDKLQVEYVELLEGKPLPTIISELTVEKLVGEDFSECKVPKKGGNSVLSHFNAADKLECRLNQKK